jgi:hypothetical protein
MANDEALKAMQTLYGSFWLNTKPAQAISQSLDQLAAEFEKTLTAATYRLYPAATADLTQAECVLAFSLAALNLRFFPTPSILREYASRVPVVDPTAVEAKEELLKLIEGMRGPHGPMLKPLPGRVLYGTEDDPKDEHGDRTHTPIRAESNPFPIARRAQAALVRLGWGDRSAGIALTADHPAVRRRQPESGDEQYKTNQLRVADEILKRFTDAYREA